MNEPTSIGLAVGAAALVLTVVAVWRTSRPWFTSSVLVAALAVTYALVRARSLAGHTPETRIALGAGLVALIVLMIRFGLAAVACQIVGLNARGWSGRVPPPRAWGRRTRTGSGRSGG
jgi:hypothetical protein